MSTDKVIKVASVLGLPYAYIPFHSVEFARTRLRKMREDGKNVDPDGHLFVYEGKLPGYLIVAYPILMEKPEEDANVQ